MTFCLTSTNWPFVSLPTSFPSCMLLFKTRDGIDFTSVIRSLGPSSQCEVLVFDLLPLPKFFTIAPLFCFDHCARRSTFFCYVLGDFSFFPVLGQTLRLRLINSERPRPGNILLLSGVFQCCC